MGVYKKLSAVAGMILLSLIVCACSENASSRQMSAMIDGIVCDPSRATLVAEQSNEKQIDSFDNLRRYKLYRTVGGHYFLQSEIGYDIGLYLVPQDELKKVDQQIVRHELQVAFTD